jgi:AcrR family transcriptional regulator
MTARAVRSDAARNRAAVLAAASRLFSARSSGSDVSMDQIAEAAGVGKGTLFRAFGDRAGLLQAVFEAHTDTFREAVTSGPAPLGPTAEPRERLHAIMTEIVRAKLAHRQLALALEETVSQRKADTLYQTAPYQWIHEVLTEILDQILADRPNDTSPRWLAHVLLAVVRADLLEHLVRTSADERQLLKDVTDTVERLLGPPSYRQ